MSHSPLLNLPGPSADLLDDIGGTLSAARDFVADYDPELVVIFSPDHYNRFFYRCMPAFCIGTRRNWRGRLRFVRRAAERRRPRERLRRSGSGRRCRRGDLSAAMDVDHGTVQPLQTLFGDITTVPVIPVFINSVATAGNDPPVVRSAPRSAIRCGTGQEVLLIGSGGLSHDPPIPTLATAPPAALDRIVRGVPMTPRSADGAAERGDGRRPRLAHGESPLQPLNPDWDRAFLDLLDTDRLAEVDAWEQPLDRRTGRQPAHEVRTWVCRLRGDGPQPPVPDGAAVPPARTGSDRQPPSERRWPRERQCARRRSARSEPRRRIR